MDWMLHNGKRLARIIGGFLLILLGIVGGFVPILQGWIFIVAGLALWSVDFEWAKRLRIRIKYAALRAAAKIRARRRKRKRVTDSDQ
jgi:uncharacterized membrane protein YbaN (DUF454 family)